MLNWRESLREQMSDEDKQWDEAGPRTVGKTAHVSFFYPLIPQYHTNRPVSIIHVINIEGPSETNIFRAMAGLDIIHMRFEGSTATFYTLQEVSQQELVIRGAILRRGKKGATEEWYSRIDKTIDEALTNNTNPYLVTGELFLDNGIEEESILKYQHKNPAVLNVHKYVAEGDAHALLDTDLDHTDIYMLNTSHHFDLPIALWQELLQKSIRNIGEK
jgi:hypothetical protein